MALFVALVFAEDVGFVLDELLVVFLDVSISTFEELGELALEHRTVAVTVVETVEVEKVVTTMDCVSSS